MNTDGLPLARAINSLRDELSAAIAQAQTENLRFAVQSIELQMQVVATTATAASASGGLWQVLTVGGSVDHSRSRTHLITLTLTPEIAGAPSVRVGDDEVTWRPSAWSQPGG